MNEITHTTVPKNCPFCNAENSILLIRDGGSKKCGTCGAYWHYCTIHPDQIVKTKFGFGCTCGKGSINTIKMASGTTIGYRHVDAYRNNQDSVKVTEFELADGEKCIIGIVTDGCSSGKYSEVGAKLFTPYISDALTNIIRLVGIDGLANHLTLAVIDKMRSFVNEFSYNDDVNFICDNLLFTIIGFVIYRGQFISFRFGDGYVNGNLIDENNIPNYIAYQLIKEHKNLQTLPYDKFQIVDNFKITEPFTYVIATDGIEDFIINEGKDYARRKSVPALTELVKHDKIYKNDKLLSFMLNAMSRKRMLSDDTSLIIVEGN